MKDNDEKKQNIKRAEEKSCYQPKFFFGPIRKPIHGDLKGIC